jgi:pyruvate/2-oxoglutarate dehydrogenase complex dihydrolipoamide acyltransferase (E2) component
MSTLVGALGQAEASAADVSEAQRMGGANRNWDLSGLHDVTIGVIPERQRFNPLYGRSLAEHERDVIKLQRGLQNSTRQMKMQNQRRKSKKQQSRKSNGRKSAKQARGEAAAAKYAKKLGGGGGRKRRTRGGRKARATPY